MTEDDDKMIGNDGKKYLENKKYLDQSIRQMDEILFLVGIPLLLIIIIVFFALGGIILSGKTCH